VFSWIAETIAVERWVHAQYTMMAPIRRTSRLIGQVACDGLRPHHTAAIFVVLAVFFGTSICPAQSMTAVVFMVLGSFSCGYRSRRSRCCTWSEAPR
jgi:hypothetical protein